ncbi:relaxase/mobilization nuclease domain-containing protein [Nocardia brasiliensis]|uniref:relaxase/mobilization nuclease domain-containing protein n=1 Tax=Nocardia brasiliensis TaxID=37326 RepID=UPI00245554E6|nr:relaxase/mobilization nuclease domain-containing protein [Nocardia brasiliensis]
MIPKISRGGRMGGLLAYLQGPGVENEHERPRLITGHDSVTGLGYDDDLSRGQAFAIAREIDAPRRAFRTPVTLPNYMRGPDGRTIIGAAGRPLLDPLQPKRDANVWHCSLSLHPTEGQLTDQQWAAIAQDFMDLMGFTTAGSGRSAARWAAIHHGPSARGNDHIHIAASAVREDGTKVDTYNDYNRAQNACQILEQRYDLQVVLGRHDHRTSRGWHRAELHAAAREAGIPRGKAKQTMREGTIEPASQHIERVVRASLAASENEQQFVETMRRQGMLLTRARDPETGEVRGWCVGAPPRGLGHHLSRPTLKGGGTYGHDLTLPRLRSNWSDTPQTRRDAEEQWRAAESDAVRVLAGDASVITDPAPLPEPLPSSATKLQINAGLAEMQQWANRLQSIPAENEAAFAAAARQAAGVMSALVLRYEATPGAAAAAHSAARLATALARYAQLPAHRDLRLPDWQRSSVSSMTTILLATRPDADPTLVYATMLQQIHRTVEAIARAAHATGNAHSARELHETSMRELDTIHNLDGPATAVLAPTHGAGDAARIAQIGRGAEAASEPLLAAATTSPTRPLHGDRNTFGRPLPQHVDLARFARLSHAAGTTVRRAFDADSGRLDDDFAPERRLDDPSTKGRHAQSETARDNMVAATAEPEIAHDYIREQDRER